MAALALFPVASSGTFSIDSHVIAAGSATRAASACFRLTSTIGEPAAGVASSATFSLISGAGAVVPGDGDDVFFTGFEDCTP